MSGPPEKIEQGPLQKPDLVESAPTKKLDLIESSTQPGPAEELHLVESRPSRNSQLIEPEPARKLDFNQPWPTTCFVDHPFERPAVTPISYENEMRFCFHSQWVADTSKGGAICRFHNSELQRELLGRLRCRWRRSSSELLGR